MSGPKPRTPEEREARWLRYKMSHNKPDHIELAHYANALQKLPELDYLHIESGMMDACFEVQVYYKGEEDWKANPNPIYISLANIEELCNLQPSDPKFNCECDDGKGDDLGNPTHCGLWYTLPPVSVFAAILLHYMPRKEEN